MEGHHEKFARDLAAVEWRELRIHMRRDALVRVAAELDLVSVAGAVAADEVDRVQGWIAGGQLDKPTCDCLAQWETNLDKPFRMLIVQPYILIQEV
ncbi:MAG: DUF2288 domain-containing protein [Pelovirga sp.]